MDATTTQDKAITLRGTGGNETEDLSTFVEEVESFINYKIASFINEYWFPILVPIGLIGNTMSFLVMIRPNNRKVSTCIYMVAISVNDNVMICLALWYWLAVAVKIFKLGLWECKIAAYFGTTTIQSSTYQILAITFDKYVAIKWPHRAVTYSTPERAKIILLSIFFFVLIYNIPHMLVSGLAGDLCLSYVVGGTIGKVFTWITFLVNGIIPFTLLIYMNYVIVQTVIKSRKMFRSNSSASGIADKNRQRTMKSAENQLTIMLLLVTTLFLILLLPVNIRFIYFSLVERDTPSKYANSMLFFHITHKLYTTNNGINFFLYCISGKRFRNDLKEMFCCVWNSSHKSHTVPQ